MKLRFLPQQVTNLAKIRPEGFLAAFMAQANEHRLFYEIERNYWEKLNKDFPTQSPRQLEPAEQAVKPATALPERKPLQVWPNNIFSIAARTLKLLRKPEDVGVGDTIARIIGPIGGDAYKQWFKDTFGRTCGCSERQQDLNAQFPYENTNPTAP